MHEERRLGVGLSQTGPTSLRVFCVFSFLLQGMEIRRYIYYLRLGHLRLVRLYSSRIVLVASLREGRYTAAQTGVEVDCGSCSAREVPLSLSAPVDKSNK